MLNKKLVLGSLAGATLLVGAVVMLPSAANAVVQGTCSNCHTMHNSADNTAMNGTFMSTPSASLLKKTCVGCHVAGTTNSTDGRDAASPKAPQVGNSAAGTMNAGGYFNTTDDTMAHSIDGSITGMTSSLTAAPGGGVAIVANAFKCESCHGANGGHHGVASSFRILQADGNLDGTTDGAIVAFGGGTAAVNYGNRESEAGTYDAASMNAFCADCHGDFHGTTNTNAASPFVRHPTDVNIDTYSSYVQDNLIPVGDTAAVGVMCLSCHRAHGSASLDLIRFSYLQSVAGNGLDAVAGCETCHGSK
jgi:hypothetical protein